MIRAALVLGALASPAAAQASPVLAEFEARCLTPMVEVRDSDVSGLTRIPHRALWESWVPESRDWELRRALPGMEPDYCAIRGSFGAEVDQWIEGRLASGNFERLDDRTPETLQSTFLREPRIEVVIDRDGESLTVIETDLES